MSHPDPATTPVQSLRGLLLLILLPWSLFSSWMISGARGLLLTILCVAMAVMLKCQLCQRWKLKHLKGHEWWFWVLRAIVLGVLCLAAFVALNYLNYLKYYATPPA